MNALLKKHHKNQEYSFVSLSKVISARIFDYILVSMLIFFFSWLIYQNQNLTALMRGLINHFMALSILLIYFVVGPYFFQGKTVAKFIFRFKLVTASVRKIAMFKLLYRELVITFIPWIILIISNLVITYGFKYEVFNFKQESFFIIKNQQNEVPLAITIILRIVGLFYLGWYSILIVLYKIEKNHQLFFDRQLKIYIVASALKLKSQPQIITVVKPKIHVHLQENLPGNINDNQLEIIDEL